MPNIDDMKTSKFLKRGDVGDGMIVTIVGIELTNVALQSSPKPDEKWCARLREFPDKLFVLNGTNQRAIAAILGSKQTEDWIGRKIVLWDDATVEFKGQTVGGIRVRKAPGGRTGAAPVLSESAERDDDVPF